MKYAYALALTCALAIQGCVSASWLGSFKTMLIKSNGEYLPAACSNLEEAYSKRLTGQHVVLQRLGWAICSHIQDLRTHSPLVVFLSGPPGVGKSETARVTAKALYAGRWNTRQVCMPEDPSCPAYLVLSGMSYTKENEESAFQHMLNLLRDHTRQYSNALIVFEDFDRLGCYFRNRFRDILDHPSVYDVKLHRAIIVMTANIGTKNAHGTSSDILTQGDKGSMQAMENMLAAELRKQCATSDDSTKPDNFDREAALANERFIMKVNYFLAYHLLTKEHIADLFEKLLKAENESRRTHKRHTPLLRRIPLKWDDAFLMSLVEHSDLNFVAGYSVLGGSRCANILKDQVLYRLGSSGSMNCHESSQGLELSMNAKTGTLHAKCLNPGPDEL